MAPFVLACRLNVLDGIPGSAFSRIDSKNYGKAGEYSGEVFHQAQQIASSTEDPALRNLLREVLVTRDQITADLAKGDPAALSEIQRLLSNLEQTAKH